MSESSPAEQAATQPAHARGGALGGAALACASLWCFAVQGLPRWLVVLAFAGGVAALVLTFRARRRRDDYLTTAALVIALAALGIEIAVTALART